MVRSVVVSAAIDDDNGILICASRNIFKKKVLIFFSFKSTRKILLTVLEVILFGSIAKYATSPTFIVIK